MRASFDARGSVLRRWAGFCLAAAATVLGVVWLTAPTAPAAAAGAVTTLQPEDVSHAGRATPAHPAREAEAQPARPPRGPVLTMLHGMGSSPSGTCARVRGAEALGLTVVCPTGNVDYGDGTADWTGEPEEKAAHLDRALAGEIEPSAERGDVLMGFSRGAFVARDVAYARPNRWRGLVLIGAALTPDAEKLRASGIRRVVLASGDHDGAKRTMVAARAKLCAAGIPARFVSLGPVWHALPEDSITRMQEALLWVGGKGDDGVPGCAPRPS
jgi:predicted esterase